MLKFNAILVFVLFFLGLPSFGQDPEPIYRRYTVDNGLISSEVYHVFQDSKGYIWFATGNGVNRFNGYNFENFDIQSGLVDNEVFEIYEDFKGRIWFIPKSGRLSYYQNGKIYNYKYNNKIKDHLYGRGPVKFSFYVDSLDYVYLSLKQFGKISISPEGIYKKYEGEYSNTEYLIEEVKGRKLSLVIPQNPSDKSVYFKGLHSNFKFLTRGEILKDRGPYYHHVFAVQAKDSSILFVLSGIVFKVKNKKIIASRDFGSDVIWMSVDDEYNLWVSPISGSVMNFPNCDISSDPKLVFLQNVQVTSVLKDSDGSYWFSSLDDGVFYCPDINCLSFSEQKGLSNNRISSVFVNDEGVFVGCEKGFVDLIQTNSFKVRHYSSSLFENYIAIRSLTGDSVLNRIWVCTTNNLFYIKNDKVNLIGRTPTREAFYPRSIINSKFGGHWVGTSMGLVRMINDKVVYESYASKEFKGMVHCLVEDSKGTVWFSSTNGLWRYSDGNYQYLASENSILAQPGSCMVFNRNDSCLWIGTNGSGIIVFKDDKVRQIAKTDGLSSNSIRQICIDKGVVWVATAHGLSKITCDNGKCNIFNYTIADGLPTNDITSVFAYKGDVYIGTSKGLSVANLLNSNDKHTPPVAQIVGIRVNNVSLDSLDKDIVLDYTQNNLRFDFVSLIYSNAGFIQYRHRLLGGDSTWIYTNSPNCLYSGLAKGNYVFEVEAQSPHGVWSSSPARLSFMINPPFWKRLWFLVFVSMLFASALFMVYRVRVSTIKRRNELVNNINQYKQQSLRQQMNPHFIFNTLNSIQLYILEKDPISSHKYLTKFARLMRMTLDNSLNSTILLKDEIEALEVYLELEKLRLEGKFDYNINYGDDKSILNYRIPTLLIQPFVENAIWHGIMLKEDQSGWVRIDLFENGKLIKCTITDNGVGREHANRIRQQRNSEHKSRGLQITQERVDLLNSTYQEKFSIQYEDLFDENTLPKGTRVVISIPKEITINSGGLIS